jgi:type I restriction enzyme M protein
MFEQVFKNIDDIFYKDAGCSSELDYTEQSSWMLFLKYLDDLEFIKSQEAEMMMEPYQYIIDEPTDGAHGQHPKTQTATLTTTTP